MILALLQKELSISTIHRSQKYEQTALRVNAVMPKHSRTGRARLIGI